MPQGKLMCHFVAGRVSWGSLGARVFATIIRAQFMLFISTTGTLQLLRAKNMAYWSNHFYLHGHITIHTTHFNRKYAVCHLITFIPRSDIFSGKYNKSFFRNDVRSNFQFPPYNQQLCCMMFWYTTVNPSGSRVHSIISHRHQPYRNYPLIEYVCWRHIDPISRTSSGLAGRVSAHPDEPHYVFTTSSLIGWVPIYNVCVWLQFYIRVSIS